LHTNTLPATLNDRTARHL